MRIRLLPKIKKIKKIFSRICTDMTETQPTSPGLQFFLALWSACVRVCAAQISCLDSCETAHM